MALIKCDECGAEISDKAISCIKCGAPLQNNVITTQQTSKKYKGEYLAGLGLMLFGVILMWATDQTNLGAIFLFLGLIAAIAARVKGWWNHG